MAFSIGLQFSPNQESQNQKSFDASGGKCSPPSAGLGLRFSGSGPFNLDLNTTWPPSESFTGPAPVISVPKVFVSPLSTPEGNSSNVDSAINNDVNRSNSPFTMGDVSLPVGIDQQGGMMTLSFGYEDGLRPLVSQDEVSPSLRIRDDRLGWDVRDEYNPLEPACYLHTLTPKSPMRI
eukprot:209048_1